MNFIKSIAEKDFNDFVHKKFIRYSLGKFERESMTIKRAKSFVSVKCGFEYLDVMYRMMVDMIDSDVSISGFIVSSKKQNESFEKLGIELSATRGKKYSFSATLTPDEFRTFLDTFSDTFILVSFKADNYSIKIKKAMPKPGKVVENFTAAKFPVDKYEDVVSEFLFDADDVPKKVAVIKHTYIINNIEVPKEYEDDPVESRLKAIRKGTIVREIDVDGKIIKKEYTFEV